MFLARNRFLTYFIRIAPFQFTQSPAAVLPSLCGKNTVNKWCSLWIPLSPFHPHTLIRRTRPGVKASLTTPLSACYHRSTRLGIKSEFYLSRGDSMRQTPSTGLRHPSFNHCRIYHVIGSRKLSANEKFFVGAQTVVNLLQTTQIISDICFITDHVAYASSDKTKIVWIETELSFLPRVDAPHVYVHASVLGAR